MDAVILAAGEGTRLRPLTSTRAKPMLPVAGKPILEWDLEALAGKFDRVTIVVGYKNEKIIDYFGSEFNGLKIEYVTQKEQLGTAHAISTVESIVKDEFLVMNGDLLISSELVDEFLLDYKDHKTTALCLTKVEDPSQFGIVELGKNNMVKNIVEKPEKPKSNLANAGIYIFNGEIFDAIRQIEKSTRLEYEITDALKILINKNEVCGFKCVDEITDIGRPWDLLKANENLLQKINLKPDEDTEIEPFSTIKGPVHIGKGTNIRSGTYIEGPCWIGKNCTIGPNCHIRPYTSIENDIYVGNAVEIKNSIIMSKTHIGHLSYVGDSVIGENCNFGAGTKVANLRFDYGEVKVKVRKKFKPSGRRKFGCLMGDNVKTGINVSIMPGRSIYPGAIVEAGSVVRNTIYSEEL